VELDQSFSPDARAEASERIDELLADAEALAPLDFYLKLASIVALADNSHSNITTSPIYEFGLLPIRSVWCSDGLYIVRARTEHERLLGVHHGGTD
jgi:hypothetical protein